MQAPGFAAFWRSRWRKRLIWAAGTFLVYLLVGFFALPPIIKWQMLKQLPSLTKRKAAIEEVRFNPLALSLTIRGLSLTEPDGRLFLSWDEFYVNFQSSSLFRWAWTFKEIRLVRPFVQVTLLKDGQLNFANMFPAPAKPPPPPPPRPGGLPRVNVFRLEITNAIVALEDQTRRTPFRTAYRDINLELSQFTTLPKATNPCAFRAESRAGGRVSWAGDLGVQPLQSRGRLEVSGVNLRRFQPYLEGFTKGVLTNGVAGLALDYQFAAGTNGLELVVTNGALRVGQVQFLDPSTGETVAGLRELAVQGGGLSWRERAARVARVNISDATLLARLQKDGRLNLLELLTLPAPGTNAAAPTAPAPPGAAAPAPPGAAAPEPPWTVTLDEFAVEKAGLRLEDLTHRTPFRTELSPVMVGVKHLTTRAGADADYSFAVTTEAAEKIEGAGTLSINPVRSAGEVKVGAVELKKYAPYAEDFFQGQIAAGKLTVTAPYHFAALTNALSAGVSNLAARLEGLEIKEPGAAETVTRLSAVDVAGVDASLDERRGHVGLVRADGGSLVARRQADGSLNLLALLAPGPTNVTAGRAAAGTPSGAPVTAAASGAAGPTNGWTARIDEVVLTNYTIQVEDRQLPKPAALLVDELAVRLKGLSTSLTSPVNVEVSTRLNQSGAFAAAGAVRVSPPAAELTLGLTNLELRAFQPWVNQFLQMGIVSGGLGTYGQVRYAPEVAGQPLVLFQGGVSLTNFLCTDEVMFKEFARWERLGVTGIDGSLEPTRLKIAEVEWVGPKATLLIREDHQPNVALLLKPSPGGATNASAAAPAAATTTNASALAAGAPAGAPAPPTPPVEIALVKLERASFSFQDESIAPHASLGVAELSGTIKGLSSAMNTTADLDLSGKVDEQSPVRILGKVNPLPASLFVDLTISNANTQLPPITPYFEKYAGHPLNRGRLTTELRYHVEGKELKAENKVAIDHLTLGPRNESTDATKLPVKLAVALLKDIHGRIDLDLPIKGRLDDPQFKLWPIIGKVLLNVVEKAATSPFKLLGALVGGGEELSFVVFTPGTTNPAAGELDKLAKLAQALAQRPTLNVEIEGAVDLQTDGDALARFRLREGFKTQELKALAAKGKAPQSLETFELAAADYARLLRAAFAQKFGTNIADILRTNQLALAGTNRAAAKPAKPPKLSLYRRAVALLGFGKREQSFYHPVLVWVGLRDHVRKSPAEKRLRKADRLALRQMTPELMETMLAALVEIKEDEYRALMTARARWVQSWLVRDGAVANERLVLVAPKPVDAAHQTACQANLSLD